MDNINFFTKIEITIMHEDINDAEGLDDVLMNIVRKWNLPVTPSVYQAKPSPVDDETKEFIKEFLGDTK